MAFRLLQHRAAGSTDASRLEPGRWEDVPVPGQFLLDVEFLTRCAPAAGSVSCLYCKSPAYLDEIARLFPWIHFYTYEHAHPVPEYDPLEPAIAYAVPITVQVQDNKTTAAQELSKDMARTIGERSAREREGLLLICHGLDPVRQLALQASAGPSERSRRDERLTPSNPGAHAPAVRPAGHLRDHPRELSGRRDRPAAPPVHEQTLCLPSRHVQRQRERVRPGALQGRDG